MVGEVFPEWNIVEIEFLQSGRSSVVNFKFGQRHTVDFSIILLEQRCLFCSEYYTCTLEKDTFLNPSPYRTCEDLNWLSYSETGNLWIYQPIAGKESVAEDMMLNKLIANPKVINGNSADYAILKFQGYERLGAISKMIPVSKIILLGIEPARLGIHLPIKPYEIFRHLDKTFLLMDSPDKMPELPPVQKAKIVGLLQTIFGIQ
jgi:hypothetical protein